MRHASGCNAVSKNCGWKPPLCSLLNYVHNNKQFEPEHFYNPKSSRNFSTIRHEDEPVLKAIIANGSKTLATIVNIKYVLQEINLMESSLVLNADGKMNGSGLNDKFLYTERPLFSIEYCEL